MFKEQWRKDTYFHLPIEVRHINDTKGWGVCALEDFTKNTVVEVSPVILYHKDLHTAARELATYEGCRPGHLHIIEEYSFNWHIDGLVALAMGYGGMYNHSYRPNLEATKQDEPIPAVIFVTNQDVKAGDELTHCYSPWDDQLSFDVNDEEQPSDDGTRTSLRYMRQSNRTFKEAVDLSRGKLQVDKGVYEARAKQILRDEAAEREQRSDDRPRIGDWLYKEEEE